MVTQEIIIETELVNEANRMLNELKQAKGLLENVPTSTSGVSEEGIPSLIKALNLVIGARKRVKNLEKFAKTLFGILASLRRKMNSPRRLSREFILSTLKRDKGALLQSQERKVIEGAYYIEMWLRHAISSLEHAIEFLEKMFHGRADRKVKEVLECLSLAIEGVERILALQIKIKEEYF